MAGIKDTASTQKSALSSRHSALSQTKTNPKKPKAHRRKSKTPSRPRRRTNMLRFPEAAGKTVEFIEMDWAADFPCVEVGFEDKTALLFLLGTRLTMEPSYTNWKTGNMRVLRRWPRRETAELGG